MAHNHIRLKSPHQLKQLMELTKEHIIEIADLLDCGMTCFFHRPTGTIESYPDPDDLFFESEPWQDTIDKIENDWDNYDRFEKMDSTQGFQVMENFAYVLTDKVFRDKIIERLSRRRPFQNFKNLINSSDYRQSWFDFKKNAYIDFVKRQIEIK
ncbi:MAG: UPF0158 family protein [Brumimicrobium sp.]